MKKSQFSNLLRQMIQQVLQQSGVKSQKQVMNIKTNRSNGSKIFGEWLVKNTKYFTEHVSDILKLKQFVKSKQEEQLEGVEQSTIDQFFRKFQNIPKQPSRVKYLYDYYLASIGLPTIDKYNR